MQMQQHQAHGDFLTEMLGEEGTRPAHQLDPSCLPGEAVPYGEEYDAVSAEDLPDQCPQPAVKEASTRKRSSLPIGLT